MKKIFTGFITLVLLLSQLTSFASPVSTTASPVSTIAPSTSLDNPYEKIHVYTTPDAPINYSSIESESELESAILALNTYATEANNLKENGSDIRITIQFTSNFSETEEFLTFRSKLNEATSFSEIREIRKNFNSFSKKYHSAVLKKNYTLLNVLDSNSITEVAYSPFVILEASQEDIQTSSLLTLARNNSITSISLETNYLYIEEEETSLLDSTAETTTSDYGNEMVLSWDDMLTCIGAKSIVDQGVYQGEGIRIGVIDSGLPDKNNNPNLVGKDIENVPNANGTAPHATAVASVIARIAPRASLVCSTYSGTNPSLSLENMIDENCDVVNISQSMAKTGEYSPSIDGIFDYLIYNHNIIVVKSAGNYSTTNPVSNPGLAYNVITVGGVTTTDTNQIIYDPISCFWDSTEYIKPNVCGLINYSIPGTIYSTMAAPASTTSFATPQVTACVALLLEYYFVEYNMWVYPEQMMALIMCGAEKTADYTVINSGLNHFDQRVGAGIFNLQNCLDSDIVVEDVFVPINNNTQYLCNAVVHLDAGETLSVALSLLVNTELSPTDSTCIVYPFEIVNYNLLLMSSDTNNFVSFSVLPNESNIELLRYTAYSSGDYVIQVRILGEPSQQPEFLGIAYSVYE